MIDWKTEKEYEEITFKSCDGVARIAFNRPEVRNAFTPKTVDELWEALIICHESQDIGVVLITGEGPSPKDGGWAFCSGGDQRVRSNTGYKGANGVNRFNILDVQRQIRFMAIAMDPRDGVSALMAIATGRNSAGSTVMAIALGPRDGVSALMAIATGRNSAESASWRSPWVRAAAFRP